jgi:hypothetical protein
MSKAESTRLAELVKANEPINRIVQVRCDLEGCTPPRAQGRAIMAAAASHMKICDITRMPRTRWRARVAALVLATDHSRTSDSPRYRMATHEGFRTTRAKHNSSVMPYSTMTDLVAACR